MKRILSMDELLESLSEGLLSETSALNYNNCICGLHRYLPYARKIDSPDRALKFISKIEERSDYLRRHENENVRRAVANTKEILLPAKIRIRFESRKMPDLSVSKGGTSHAKGNILENLTFSDRIIKVWRLHADSTADDPDDYQRNHWVTSDDVLSLLMEDFSEDVIESEIIRFFQEMADICRYGDVPNSRDLFLISSCLLLASHAVTIPRSLVNEILRLFPVIYCYEAMNRLIAGYLTPSEVIESLLNGLTLQGLALTCLNCAEGIRFYPLKMLSDSDLENIPLGLSPKIDDRLAGLARHEDGLVRETAMSVRKWLKFFHGYL